MKNRKMIIGSLALSAILFLAPAAQAADDLSQTNLQKAYEEEVMAQTLYEAMVEKFDHDDYYSRFIRAEGRHAGSIERLMGRMGYTVKEAEISVEVDDDELKALEFAYQYELDDIASMEEKIQATDDEEEIRAYERLKRGSERHVASLERAIQEYKETGSLEAISAEGMGGQGGQGRDFANRGRNSEGMRRGGCRQGQQLRDGSGPDCIDCDGLPKQDGNGNPEGGRRNGSSQGRMCMNDGNFNPDGGQGIGGSRGNRGGRGAGMRDGSGDNCTDCDGIPKLDGSGRK